RPRPAASDAPSCPAPAPTAAPRPPPASSRRRPLPAQVPLPPRAEPRSPPVRTVRPAPAPTYGRVVTSPPETTTLGELRASGHVHRGVKAEIRENLLALLAAGEPTLPGIVGFDETVLPEVERALLAGHDMVLLGE